MNEIFRFRVRYRRAGGRQLNALPDRNCTVTFVASWGLVALRRVESLRQAAIFSGSDELDDEGPSRGRSLP